MPNMKPLILVLLLAQLFFFIETLPVDKEPESGVAEFEKFIGSYDLDPLIDLDFDDLDDNDEDNENVGNDEQSKDELTKQEEKPESTTEAKPEQNPDSKSTTEKPEKKPEEKPETTTKKPEEKPEEKPETTTKKPEKKPEEKPEATTEKPEDAPASTTTTEKPATTEKPYKPSFENPYCNYAHCNQTNKCQCLSDMPPNGLADPKGNPQLILMTFDGAITVTNYPYYLNFSTVMNPGGCPVRATYFVSHVDTNYRFVNELFRQGNEIGVHSISESKNSRKEYWENLDFDGWRNEFAGQRKILATYARVPESLITGARAPDLQTAGNVTYEALVSEKFKYTSTNPSRRGILSPFYPYTLDYGFQQDCQVRPCLKPNQTYPHFWEVPMNDWNVHYKIGKEQLERQCATAAACIMFNEDGSINYHPTAEQIYDLFMDNFERYYKGNRAPFPLYLSEEWMHDQAKREGLWRFMSEVLRRQDVFFVTMQDMLRWMKKPSTTEQYSKEQRICRPVLRTRCGSVDVHDVGNSEHRCQYLHIGELGGQAKDMFVCDHITCPVQYPWLKRIQ